MENFKEFFLSKIVLKIRIFSATAMIEAIQAWWSEIGSNGIDADVTNFSQSDVDADSGHFTQVTSSSKRGIYN